MERTLIVVIFFIFLIPLYYLSDNVVYENHYYYYILYASILITITIICLKKTFRLAVLEKFTLNKKESKLLDLRNKLYLKIEFYLLKLAMIIGCYFFVFYLTYSVFNLSVYLGTFISTKSYVDVVDLYKLESYKNNLKYEFFFKKSIVSLHTEMNDLNRQILDNQSILKKYKIKIIYKKSFNGAYFIFEKQLTPSSAKSE